MEKIICDAVQLNGKYLSSLSQNDLNALLNVMSVGRSLGIYILFETDAKPCYMQRIFSELQAFRVLKLHFTKINVSFDDFSGIPNSFFRVKFKSN